jgi:hypothetical protein
MTLGSQAVRVWRIGVVALTLITVAGALPAGAEGASYPDARYDVTYYDWDNDEYHEGQWDELDIHTVSIDASAAHVTVATKVAALTEGWWSIFQTAYDVNGDSVEDFRLNVLWDGTYDFQKVSGTSDTGVTVGCGGIGVSVEYGNSQVVTAVPRSCLANTASVGVSVASYDQEYYECDCNDQVLDVWPDQIGTYSPMLRYADTSAPPPTSASYDPNGPSGTVYRLYRAYFLREPDPDGYAYWLGVYRNGYPLDKISNDFARSAEFQQRYGSVDNRQFLTLVYQNVLSRNPDDGGYAYWTHQMEQGMLRGFVMIYFSDSEEFRSKTAAGRPPGS